MPGGEAQRIFIVLPTWVGDFVMATPTLGAVRHRFPTAHITFLAQLNLRELIAGGPWMDEVIEWPSGKAETQKHRNAETQTLRNSETHGVEQVWRPTTLRALVGCLRGRRFDLALLLPNSFRAAIIAWLSGAKRRVGYARDGRSVLLTDPLPVPNRRGSERAQSLGSSIRVGTNLPVRLGRYVPMPLVEYYADLAESIGCERPGHQLELFTTADCEESLNRRLNAMGANQSGRSLVVISPGAKFGASKCWAPERFAAVADEMIRSFDAFVAITCGPGEEGIARAIARAMKDPTGGNAAVFDSPRLSLGELKSLIRRCRLWIGNDAGPRHIAKAFGVPAVTVFGPTHPDWTPTNYPKERIVRIDVDCGPCQQRTCPLGHHQCMTGVSVDAVMAAAGGLLRSQPAEV